MKHTSLRWVWAACTGFALLCCSAQAERVQTSTRSGGPRLRPKGALHSQEAIQKWQDRLPEIARRYRTDAQSLHFRLRTDASLAIDDAGQLLYTCEGPQAAPVASGTLPVTAAIAPLSDTFLLHSRPGATKVIYLDFDGHTTTGTSWNTYFSAGAPIVTPAYDQDGVAGFSDAEKENIQRIWQRVAEDFAPFEVDVTTEDPGIEALRRTTGTDQNYGVRVCIGGSSFDWYGAGAGGVAYVGSFSYSTDTPCFVFEAQLGNGDAKFTAEATSHEAGHTLGLSHDGTNAGVAYYEGHGSGNTGWAPIMGVGYYKPVVQWSRGEYANANNLEDDLATIASYVGYRADDHGNSIATATYMPVGGSFVTAGIIGEGSDVDVFAFTTRAGTISLSASVDDLSPNLDVQLQLTDASGNVLNTINPATTLNATLSTNVPEGTYFVHIKGVGFGDPLNTGYSAYDSKGTFILNGTVIDPTGQVPPVAVVGATPTSGEAPLVVAFNGTSSFDPDGTIVSYAWEFGDGTTGSGATVSKTYTSIGSYVARLTVTDDSGLSASSTTTITVLGPNLLPTAAISTSTSSGIAPLTVSFSGSGSTDPDGTIASYSWNFGDGSTASGVNVSKTFSSPGTFTVTLTVTDNRGGIDTETTTIVVSPNPAQTIRVQSIGLSVATSSRGKTVTATVRITDLNGANVSSATVNGRWGGLVSGNVSARTGKNGTISFTSSRFTSSGTVSFTVTGVSKAGVVYDPTRNVVTSASISAARTP